MSRKKFDCLVVIPPREEGPVTRDILSLCLNWFLQVLYLFFILPFTKLHDKPDLFILFFLCCHTAHVQWKHLHSPQPWLAMSLRHSTCIYYYFERKDARHLLRNFSNYHATHLCHTLHAQFPWKLLACLGCLFAMPKPHEWTLKCSLCQCMALWNNGYNIGLLHLMSWILVLWNWFSFFCSCGFFSFTFRLLWFFIS